ncbi:ribulose-phosphate 3-epimerase [Treponema phagedenis]|uniref:Ribulose-phosphate 3-epimerase n=1 Tax=Treponema phagedenis TaxID=162 RepID=A0A0B7GT17_TREPH|nr:ribulose-phosphate 3-epimerase [Treponema phagedenis]EFW36568.1 ribulose-phosphate 3-epimerase [Treponema phagedenis F0421]NVP23341.1 ribulose-phosphate 3-epimerase [Treponema phagedenis]QEJ95557.1 ribulose-phosphate 3-epimerase [Treponema phagedenis]QEJ98450.1 ribulose-phosphate 3-epimerase [Treponema phagedenis]QEK01410.1 ribulose-phosphate 3-epimerase [Treponema phagedenis]
MRKSFLLAPSLLSADFSKLGSELIYIEENGGKLIHVDVMDGHFVPNLSFGAPVLKSLKGKTSLPFDVHFMVTNPSDFVKDFAEAGAEYFTFHIEAAVHAHRLIGLIREYGMKPGISLVPSTPVSVLQEVLPFADLVLVMSVNPGFGGQKMIPECIEKIRQLKKIREEKKLSYLISVDGGINSQTLPVAAEAGADIIVSGSSFFSGELRV